MNMQDFLKGAARMWIGLNDIDGEGTFKWEDGTVLGDK